MTDRVPPRRAACPLPDGRPPRGGPRLRGRHPRSADDPSYADLQACATVLDEHPRPTLLLWGGRDPVFHDRFLADLRARAPRADVERFADGRPPGHARRPGGPGASPGGSTGSATRARRRHRRPTGADALRVGARLARRPVQGHVARLRRAGRRAVLVRPRRPFVGGRPRPAGRRSAPGRPGVGAGPAQRRAPRGGERPCGKSAGSRWWPTRRPASADLRALIRAAAPSWTVGTPATLAAARAPSGSRPDRGRPASVGFPGAVALDRRPGAPARRSRCLRRGPDDVAALVHTSGATGPAKAVRYTHGALAAQRDVVGPLFGMRPGDAFTTSFAPFLLLAPSLRMTCIRPDVDVDEPSALGFDSCTTPCAVDTSPWRGSPPPRPAPSWPPPGAARRRSDLVMLAGAPIPADLVPASDRDRATCRPRGA